MASIVYSIKDIENVITVDGNIRNVDVTRLTAAGENFLSLVLQADFKVEKDGHFKIISTVAKRLPLKKQEEGDIHGHVMKNEIKWYSEIIPVLKEFALEIGVEMDFYPEVLGWRYSLHPTIEQVDSDSVLVLKNLILEGYQVEDRYVGLDLITSKAALKKLAVFHALPIALKIKNPEQFKILEEYLEKSRYKPQNQDIAKAQSDDDAKLHDAPTDAKTPQELLLEALADLPDVVPHMPKIKPLYTKEALNITARRKLTKEPWNTIVHGDFWLNNIMIKYQGDKNPLVKILDFQMYCYGPFAKDVVFFLLTSVRNDVTKESMNDLLRFYYDELMSVLRNTNVNLDITYNEYLNEIRNAAVSSELEHAIFFTTIVFGEKGTGVDVLVEEFDPLEVITKKIKNMGERHKNKLSLIVHKAVELNWI